MIVLWLALGVLRLTQWVKELWPGVRGPQARTKGGISIAFAALGAAILVGGTWKHQVLVALAAAGLALLLNEVRSLFRLLGDAQKLDLVKQAVVGRRRGI